MLKNFFDFGKTKIISTPEEILFFEFLEKHYGITAVETHFCKGKIQNSLNIWIDTEKHCFTEILNKVDLRTGNCLNYDISNTELNDFAEAVINKYISIFDAENVDSAKMTTDINGNQIPKTALYIYDFNYYLKSYAYGHAITDIKKTISEKYKIEKKNILVFSKPSITIIAEDDNVYYFLKKDIDELKRHSYIELKKHDIYNIISKNSVDIEILLKTQISSSVLNDYYMKQ